MKGPSDETVGENFSAELLQAARDKTLAVIEKAALKVQAGMTENEARELVAKTQEEMGASRFWHPPQIRFGENSTKSFGKPGVENPTLKENDIFFFDIGPVFDEHEGDVGRTFAIGNDEEMQKCAHDVEEIWHLVRDEWKEKGLVGAELYAFATKCAEERGWRLALEKANGHRIADFPHAARIRGSVEEYPEKLSENRWILEIQIEHRTRKFGAFYEDLLN